MYDALRHNLQLARRRSTVLESLGLKKGSYALATVHRAAKTDDQARMAAILTALSALCTQVIFPVHPRTRNLIRAAGLAVAENVKLIEPVGHFDILILQENASCVLTISGGMQKEAYMLGVRCITLREETEWAETVHAGWNKLAGVDGHAIQSLFETWHPNGERPTLYGDGNAVGEICEILSRELIA